MRLLFISQTYSPSHDAISQILTDLAEDLIPHNFDVHVLTNQMNYMTGEPLPLHETRNGVTIWRVPGFALQRSRSFSRASAYGAFLALSTPTLLLIPKPDIIVYLSTPPMIGWSASITKQWCDAKTIYWAQDVYPDVPEKMGYLKNHLLKSILRYFDKKIMSRMDAIVCIGELMAQIFKVKEIPNNRIHVIPNWSPIKAHPVVKQKSVEFLTTFGINQKFVVQYSGNMGVVHDMNPIIEAVIASKENADIHWLMVGDGKRRNEVEMAVSKHSLNNVTFAPYQPLDKLWETLHSADISLISLRSEMEGLVVPSKLYAALEAGRPIVFIGSPHGEIAQIIFKFNCGITVQTGEELYNTVLYLKDDPAKLKQMSQNAKNAYEQHMTKKHRVRDFINLFEKLVTS